MSGGGFGGYNYPSHTTNNNPNKDNKDSNSGMPTNNNGEGEKKQEQHGAAPTAGLFGFEKKHHEGEAGAANGSPMKVAPTTTGATANSGLFSNTPATSSLFGSSNTWGKPAAPTVTSSTASPMKHAEEKPAATTAPAFGFSPFKAAEAPKPAAVAAPSFGSFGASPAKPVTSTPFGSTTTESSKPVFSGFGTPHATPSAAETKVEEQKPAFGGISSSNGTPRKSSLEGKETPSRPTIFEHKATPVTTPMAAPVSASPRKPSIESVTAAPVTASPRKPSLETVNKPAQFTASPRKPSVETVKPFESPKPAAPKPVVAEAAPVAASPRKSSIDAGTPRKSSIDTPRRPSHESLQQTPKPVSVPVAAPAPAASFVTPQRDNVAAKLKEQSASAAILGQALSHPASAAKVVEAPKPKPVEKPVEKAAELKVETPKKTHRSESIDDSWVKVDKEELAKAAEPKKAEAKKVEKAEPKKVEKAAPASPKKPRAPKAAAKPVEAGNRRTSSRARQAPAEMPIEMPVAASVAKKTTEMPAGSGTKLGDIPHVAGMLTKKKAGDKTVLMVHRLVFGRPGEANKRKTDLRQFNGFPASFDRSSLDKKLQSQTVPALRDLCIFFNLERSGEKVAMAARLTEFLVSPKDQGKSKPVQAKKVIGKKKAAPKGKAAGAKKAKTSAGKKANGLSPETVESEDDYAEEIASLKAGADKQ